MAKVPWRPDSLPPELCVPIWHDWLFFALMAGLLEVAMFAHVPWYLRTVCLVVLIATIWLLVAVSVHEDAMLRAWHMVWCGMEQWEVKPALREAMIFRVRWSMSRFDRSDWLLRPYLCRRQVTTRLARDMRVRQLRRGVNPATLRRQRRRDA
ncbi:MAG: hypothetical protein GC129_07400 [Proteobacteria bacterium]|nr:hypothetical protein [Pseudomonadota bacterium]